MNTPNAASAADTPAAAPATKQEPAKSELKSTDTGILSAIKARAETATPQPEAPKPEDAKPASHATPAVKGADADSSEAEHQDDERKLEPWMRKRLSRAEERGRQLGRSEILDTVRTLRTSTAEPSAKADSTQTPQQPAAAKTLADFDYDLERYNAHVIREGVKQALAERDAENDRQRQQRAAEEARQAFETRKAQFESRVGEGAWDEMVSARVEVPQEVIDLLVGHPKDLDIAHYLVLHGDELDKLRGKSRLEIAAVLTAIDAKLSGPRQRQEELPPKTTKAPPPPPSIAGAGKSSKSIDDMTTAERIAEWRRQKQQRREPA